MSEAGGAWRVWDGVAIAWGSAREVDVVMIKSLAPRGHGCLMRLTPGYNWPT